MDKLSHRRAGAGVGAGGRLKQRLTQLLVRSSCTTNTTKPNTTTSATAFVSLDKANANPHHQEHSPRHSPDFCVPCTHHHQHQSPKLEGHSSSRSRRSRASVVHVSIECTGGAAASSDRRSVNSDAPLLSSPWPRNDAKKQSRSGGKSRRSPSASRRHYCSSCSSSFKRARARARLPRRYSFSWTDDELAPFSGEDESGEEEEAETRTLFSSLSFSSNDSTSEFYHTNSSSTVSRKSRSHKNARRRAPPRALVPEAFRPGVPVAAKHQMYYYSGKKEASDGLGHGGQAVVKRSSNPYADFRSSMVEMVVERRIASVGKMEELLLSYLSLNSSEHHPSILAAFEDVWEALFGEP